MLFILCYRGWLKIQSVGVEPFKVAADSRLPHKLDGLRMNYPVPGTDRSVKKPMARDGASMSGLAS